MPSQNRQTLDLFIKHLDALDAAGLAPLIDDTPNKFTHQFFPDSLRDWHHNTVRSKEAFLERLAGLKLKGHIGAFNLEVLDVVEAPDAIVMHTRSNATLAGKPYNNEYVFTVRFNDEGKIVSIREFIDSAYTRSVLPDLKEGGA